MHDKKDATMNDALADNPPAAADPGVPMMPPGPELRIPRRQASTARARPTQPPPTATELLAAIGSERRNKILGSIGDGALPALSAPASETLTNRKVPLTRLSIDRLVVATSGVWVIDDCSESGEVHVVESGRRSKIMINGRDRSKLIRKAEVATAAVTGSLEFHGKAEMPVRRVFCCTDQQFPGDPIEVDGVTVTNRSRLDALIDAPGTIANSTLAELVAQLAERFIAN